MSYTFQFGVIAQYQDALLAGIWLTINHFWCSCLSSISVYRRWVFAWVRKLQRSLV